MKLAIWAVFSLLALLWTGWAFLAAELTQWAVQGLASGEAASFGQSVAQWPVPQWVSLWVNPALIQEVQLAVVWLIEALRDAMPVIGSALGLLVAVVWVCWGLGLVAMLAAAIGAHLLVGRLVAGRRYSA